MRFRRLYDNGLASAFLFRFDGIGLLIPGKSLNLCRLQIGAELAKGLGKLCPENHIFRQMVEVRNTRLFENRHHILEALIHMPQMIRQMVGKQTARSVSGVELHCCLNVPLHAVRVAIIADGTKGLLVAVVEAIRARKRLNQILVFQDLVEIERIDPLRVKACEHLIHDNQKIQLLLRLDTLIRLFVRKPRRHIFLEPVIAADVKALPVARVVVLEHRFQALFFVESLFPALVVNGRVKESGHA